MLNTLPMRRGLLCLVAIIDLAIRKVLSLTLAEHIGCRLLYRGLEEALVRLSKPEIFKSGLVSQLTRSV